MVLVLVLVVMYKLWAREQQLAAAESNANLRSSTELWRLGCCESAIPYGTTPIVITTTAD